MTRGRTEQIAGRCREEPSLKTMRQPLKAAMLPLGLLSPAFLLTFVFLAFALLLLVGISLREVKLATLDQIFRGDITLANYRVMLGDPETWHSLLVTLRYVIWSSVFAFGLGLATALLLNRKLPAQRFFRTLVLVPWAVPGVTATIAFLWMLQPSFGLVNFVLRTFGWIQTDIDWFGSPVTALGAIVVPTVWKTYPFFTVMLLAALQSVPREFYEAAAIDGAGRWQQFRFVTWPCIRPTALIALVFNAMHVFREFDFIYASTRGGPAGATESIAIRIYNMAFQSFDLSGAAALGVLTFALLAVAMLLVLRWQVRLQPA
jgi:multiple sugar transport system permease protein